MIFAFTKNLVYDVDMGTTNASSGPPHRVVRVVEMTQDASTALDRFVGQTGINKKLVVSRVLEWFSSLSREAQVAIMFSPEDVAVAERPSPSPQKGQGDEIRN